MDRVLEIGGYAAGFCGRLFVQAGCEVVRVEPICFDRPEARAPAWVRDEAMDLFLHPGSCRDGWVYINIIPTFWDALATFLERPEILEDERFTTNDLRKANREAMHEIVEQSLAPWSKKEVEARATAARIPATVVQTLEEVLADAHLAERDFWQIVEGGSQAVHVPSLPFRFDNEPRPSFSLSRVESANEVRDG